MIGWGFKWIWIDKGDLRDSEELLGLRSISYKSHISLNPFKFLIFYIPPNYWYQMKASLILQIPLFSQASLYISRLRTFPDQEIRNFFSFAVTPDSSTSLGPSLLIPSKSIYLNPLTPKPPLYLSVSYQIHRYFSWCFSIKLVSSTVFKCPAFNLILH